VVIRLLGGTLMMASLLYGEGGATTGKCLTPFVSTARSRPIENAGLQRRLLAGRPLNELSTLSPSGKFRIHYDTSSASQNLPAMVDGAGNRIPLSYAQYVDSVAMIFDSVWKAEISTFNFPPPPADNNAGGGNEFDVYVQDLGANNFGGTQPETEIPDVPAKPNPRWISYIVIDNDFGIGFRTQGIPAVRVTAAHEFFHAIQLGGYGLWDENEVYFYEITAEAMESVVFPSVKDYVKDIYLYFRRIESLPLYDSNRDDSYGRAIWGVYLVQQYGIEIMKSIWEQVALLRPMAALDKALLLYGISLQQAFATFALWNYHTGFRADTVRYYRDGPLFPTLNIAETQNISLTPYTFQRTARSYTMQYVRVIRNTDSVYYSITNANTIDAVDTVHGVFAYTLDVSSVIASGWSALPNGMSYRFFVADARNWSLIPFSAAGFFSSSETAPFPNPFDPKRSSLLFPMPAGTRANTTLYVFSSSMELVAEANLPAVSILGKQCYEWNGKNNKGGFVSSGVYFYVIKADGIDVRGKIAVVR